MRHSSGCDRIMPAVEMADEADHLGFAGVCACQAQREVRGFGARRCEAHPLGAGNEALHKLRPAHFEFMRGAPGLPLCDLLLHGGYDGRLDVAEDERSVTAEII